MLLLSPGQDIKLNDRHQLHLVSILQGEFHIVTDHLITCWPAIGGQTGIGVRQSRQGDKTCTEEGNQT